MGRCFEYITTLLQSSELYQWYLTPYNVPLPFKKSFKYKYVWLSRLVIEFRRKWLKRTTEGFVLSSEQYHRWCNRQNRVGRDCLFWQFVKLTSKIALGTFEEKPIGIVLLKRILIGETPRIFQGELKAILSRVIEYVTGHNHLHAYGPHTSH